MTSRRNKKMLDEFKSKLVEKGIDIEEFEDYFKIIENNLKNKKYGLVWEEHTEEIEKELVKKFPILKEEKELRIHSTEEGLTNNFLIEGDNLESLTALKNMGKKVDVIYIDPPYNTGNKDFVYTDSYVDGEDSFRHSKWLSFMEARLKLVRDLLTDDGVTFISIDDNEQAQLKLMMDKIFGEHNVESFIWNKIGNGSSSEKMKVTKRFRRDHEYILVGYKNKERINFNKVKEVRNYKQKLKNPDNDPRGDYKAGALCRSAEKSNPNSAKYYTVTSPSGKTWTRQWLVSETEFQTMDNDNRIYWGKNDNGTPASKIFGNEPSIVYPSSLILDKGSASTSSRALIDILGDSEFSNPKPTQLIKYLLEMIPNKSATVLDFFAGSGTTGHAILELNKEDGGNRNFILCTNNENNICRDVTYQRMSKVMNGYTTPKGKDIEGIPANLTYLKTELKDKEDNLGEFGLDETLIEHSINVLKVTHNTSKETELIENVIYELVDSKTNTKYIIYNNFYIDEDELKKVNKSENNIIYVSEDNLQDSNLLDFDEVRSLNDLLVYK